MSTTYFGDAPDEPPTPNGEGDYGSEAQNIVPLPRRKRQQPGWKAEWHTSETGTPLPTLFNAMVALRCHPTLARILRYDEMARAVILHRQIPNTPPDSTIPRQITDTDVLAIQEELQLTGLRRIAKATVQDAVQLYAEQDKYHPVREYLENLAWDGTRRIFGWLGRYLGVDGCPYSDTIGEMFLIALVARQFEPGCKADYMPILEGPQGTLKSSACRVLAGEWFSDNLPDLARGDAVRLSMHLRGKWLIEIAEMSSFSAAESHTLKEFITQSHEQYTPKYGRFEVKEPRQCLFVGTTNEAAYLRDATGGRRFWPVKVGEILLDDLRADRDQLLAEAVYRYREGAAWWPSKEFEEANIVPQQTARYEEDPWQETIVGWLDGGARQYDADGHLLVDGDNNPILTPFLVQCSVMQLLRGPLRVPLERISVREQRRVAGIFRHIGWISKRTEQSRFFERPRDLV